MAICSFYLTIEHFRFLGVDVDSNLRAVTARCATVHEYFRFSSAIMRNAGFVEEKEPSTARQSVLIVTDRVKLTVRSAQAPEKEQKSYHVRFEAIYFDRL